MRKICFYVAVVAIFSGCGQGKKQLSEFSSVLYEPVEASGFTITAVPGGGSSLLTVTDPWQGADNVSTQLLILRGGETAPDGFDGQVLDGDAERIVAMSSTFVAMLDRIDAVDRVVGVSGIGFISNPYIAGRRDKVGDVGYEGNIDYETLVSLDPDIVLLYGVNGASMMEAKLEELGVPYMYVGDYLEQSPVGKAEWMVALGEIVGKRELAEAVFSRIKASYDSLAAAVAPLPDRPKVMINAPYGDSWFMPSLSSYMVRLITDAGGEYVFSGTDGNSSVSIGDEQAYLLASESDVWLNPGLAFTIGDLVGSIPKFADVKPVRNRRVYNNIARMTPSGGNDFYESGAVCPDSILADLIRIFHGEDSVGALKYYKRLE